MAKKKTEAAPAAAPAPAWSIETTTPQFFAGGKPVAKVTVEWWNYSEFSAAIREANRQFRDEDSGEDWAVFWQRYRVLHQMRAFDASGNPMKVDVSDLSLMPIRQGIALFRHIDTASTGKPGDLVRDKDGKPTGDGIEIPLVFRLGRPLRARIKGNDVTKDVEVSELEFIAKTYGDIEAVCAAEGTADVVPAMVRIARGLVKDHPLGEPDMEITTDMIRQLSYADGDAILRHVVPHFLAPPAAGMN